MNPTSSTASYEGAMIIELFSGMGRSLDDAIRIDIDPKVRPTIEGLRARAEGEEGGQHTGDGEGGSGGILQEEIDELRERLDLAELRLTFLFVVFLALFGALLAKWFRLW